MRWKRQDLRQWHRVFAWTPVHVEGQTIWLETVERRREPGPFPLSFEYRLPAHPDAEPATHSNR